VTDSGRAPVSLNGQAAQTAGVQSTITLAAGQRFMVTIGS
jgi:hypothetical protein